MKHSSGGGTVAKEHKIKKRASRSRRQSAAVSEAPLREGPDDPNAPDGNFPGNLEGDDENEPGVVARQPDILVEKEEEEVVKEEEVKEDVDVKEAAVGGGGGGVGGGGEEEEDDDDDDDDDEGEEAGENESYPLSSDVTFENEAFDEIYAADRYAEKGDGTQIYARKRTRDEYYWEDRPGNDVYAKRRRVRDGRMEKYYARTYGKTDIPAFKMNDGGGSAAGYITQEDGSQIYPSDDYGNQFYIPGDDGRPMFALDGFPHANGRAFYAKKTEEDEEGGAGGAADDVEFLPEEADGRKTYIALEKGRFKIPFNLTKMRPLYETDENGDERYFRDDYGNEYYATHETSRGREFYAADRRGREIAARKKKRRRPFYAKEEGGENERYPKRGRTGGEYYIKIGKQEQPAFRDERFVYAKDEELNEYYPRHDDVGEYYIRNVNSQRAAIKKDDGAFYARNGEEDEYYPKEILPGQNVR